MSDPKLKALDGIKATSNSMFTDIAEAHIERRSALKKRAFSSLAQRRGEMELLRIIREASNLTGPGQHLAMGKLREAVSSGDFPVLFQTISQASMLGQYAELPQQWPTFAVRTTVPDFRPARMVRWDSQLDQLPDYNGGADRHVRALPRIPELTEYPTFNLTTEGADYFVNKYGARFPFSWEAFMNDELRVLQQLPTEMARWARDTEDVLTTGVLATAEGPNPDFFNQAENFGSQVGTGNYVKDNPPLSLDALEKAIQQIGMRQVNGRQVRVQNFVLLVPPSLALTAQAIAQSTTYVRVHRLATDEEIRTNVSSPVAGRFTVVESPWLPLIDQSRAAPTTWYLLPAGGQTERGPAIVTAFLRGHEVPEVRVMGDTGRAIGGGDIPAFEGSFSHDDIQYRVRSIIGAAGLDTSAVAVSRGNGESTGPAEDPHAPGLMRGPVIPVHDTDPNEVPDVPPPPHRDIREQIASETRAAVKAELDSRAKAEAEAKAAEAEVKEEAETKSPPPRSTGRTQAKGTDKS
ncbi:hypothetical protein [Streptomyces sp. 5-10]|uniref:phage major capsid protein n=1 Tax=Streptomyces sp. 5-10 TaxID=878925 RepID=UPI00168BDF47|nr:hypothetical protein [Streptomyces sp. 5-10]MBD3004537.1 hypothetical protein [Streptomyces sp. 5-10]